MCLLNDHAVAGSTPCYDLRQVVCACVPLGSKRQILQCTGLSIAGSTQCSTELKGVPPLSPILGQGTLTYFTVKQGIGSLHSKHANNMRYW